MKGGWKPAPGSPAAAGAGKPSAGKSGSTGANAGRTTFWQAVGNTMADRWKKRGGITGCVFNPTPSSKGGTKGAPSVKSPGPAGGAKPNTGGPKGTGPGATAGKGPSAWKTKPGKTKPKKPGPKKSRPKNTSGPGTGSGTGSSGAGTGPGFTWARSSPWDYIKPVPTTITVEQAGPARRNRQPWESEDSRPAAPASQPLPSEPRPALPRAPYRPAGKRPGTTRKKEPIPMGTAPAGAFVAKPRPGGMAAEHATEVTKGDCVKVLAKLVTEGMETHDDCDGLAKSARKLLGQLETMVNDLSTSHNVGSQKVMKAAAETQNTVLELLREALQMAKDALAAAELAEVEESQMKQDYQPIEQETADQGLVTPSSRLHNEN
ncbi:hypothetical protein [Streptomyces sp. NPDC047525]|uniref:hypothetical protein n=1 Tax=Streptomyces sp. NPDC047525 TaxID=3155264 RepID=UPI0033D6B364